ncbi:MAG: putative thioredoxin family protein [Bacteroidota bacterium]
MIKALFFFLLLIPCNMLAQSDSIIVTGKFSTDLLQSEWFQQWNNSSVNYQPDAATMEQLATIPTAELQVIVYLGTWCDDSKLHVPAFLNIAHKMELDFVLIGVNREKECPFEKKECKNWDIQNVPTFVVKRNDVEIGRIIETPAQSIEKDLLKLLK